MESSVGKVIRCRAAILWATMSPFTVEEVEIEPPKDQEVRIKVIANSVCHSDLHVFTGAIGASNPVCEIDFPCLLGHEATGVVESVGNGVTSVAVGDRVVTLFNGHCRECVFCKNPKTNLCLTRQFGVSKMNDGTGRIKVNGKSVCQFVGIGSLSEYTVIEESQVAKINANARMDRACIFACGFSTGFGSVVNVAKVEKGSNVAVWGMGTVGLSAVYGARVSGAANIIGVDTNEKKIEIAKKLGCNHFVNPLKCKEEDKNIAEVMKSLTNGFGVDYAFECVGKAVTLQQAIDSLAPWGTAFNVGVSDGEMMQISPNTFLSGKKVSGALNGGYKSRDGIPLLVQDYVDGKIDVEDFFTDTVKLDCVNNAFQWLQQGNVLRTVVQF